MYRIYFLFLFLFFAGFIYAQTDDYYDDIIGVEAGSIIYFADTTLVIVQDTVLHLPDSIDYLIDHPGDRKSDRFYQNLEYRASRRRWIRELHNIIIIKPSEESVKDTLHTRVSEDYFTQYEGKTIRNITFRKLDVFGPTVYDTSVVETTWFNKTANRIHINTRDRVLNNHLLIKPGDVIDPYIFADNERLFREQSYIDDVKFILDPVNDESGYVDVVVLVKDVWPKAFGLELSDVAEGRFDIWDRNIFGFGHENQNNIYWDGDEDSNWGYEGIYRVSNIAGSFIDGKVHYMNVFDTESYGVDLQRSFFTPGIKYAGGFTALNQNSIERVSALPDTSFLRHRVNYSNYDFWIGRAFPFEKRNLLTKARSSLVLSASANHYKFFERPAVTENAYWKYHNRTIVLGSIAFTEQNFYRGNLIFGFGRTEDIPYGHLFKLTLGHEFGEFQDRYYYGFRMARGSFLFNWGYLYNNLEVSSFLNNEINQGIIKYGMNFFTNLFVINRFNFRQFANFTYVRGINRFTDEYLYIDYYRKVEQDHLGIFGKERFSFNFESVLFTPYSLFDFKFVIFSTADFHFFGDTDKPIFHEQLHSSFGLGIRIRNERLVFNTLQVKFSYYPGTTNPMIFDATGEVRLRPRNFFVQKPGVVEFR